MQWLRSRAQEDPAEFWRATAAKRGGEIGLFTFATLLGKSGDQPLNLPGLLYTVADAVWFEDFERDNWLARVMGGRQKYEKTELRFLKGEVAFTRPVSRGTAARCIAGVVSPDATRALSPLARLFSTPAAQVSLKDGSALFIEVLLLKELFAWIAAH
jgi:hypothetical protein